MKKFLLLAVLGLSALGFAQIQQLDLNVSQRLSALTGGLLIMPASLLTSNSKINDSKITRSLGGSATIDFAAGAIGCEDSSAVTVTGARAGDTCHVGAPVSVGNADAGAKGTFTCYVSAADAVKVRFCTQSYENPASDTFKVRVFSNQ